VQKSRFHDAFHAIDATSVLDGMAVDIDVIEAILCDGVAVRVSHRSN